MKKRANPNALRPFVGGDGEGGDDANGYHQYLLLRVGDITLESPTGGALSVEECLSVLADLPTDKEYVSYFFDYDVTMMLRGLPEERIRRLLDRDGRTWSDRFPPHPVDWRGFQFDYLPHKEFRVRRVLGNREYTPWVLISDVGTFFQCSFLKALERWGIGTPEVREKIAAGKLARAEFGVMTEEIREYNALEIELLEDLMTQFRQVCIEVGYVPRVWQGPGNMATAMLSKHGLPRTNELTILPDRVMQYAQNAYYGGRFETTAVGPVKGPVYQYDINSAYPYACTLLPCLIHSTWHHTNILRGMGVYQIRFTHSRGQSLHHFPVRRKDGSIHYPRMGGGWYWWPEIKAAINAGASVSVRDGWFLSKGCECEPFQWVKSIYQQRLKLGKTGKGMVLKLGLNSLYGKQAQSIGAAPYANPIYAGLITAITRAVLVSAYSHAPYHTVMLATDGLFTTTPLPIASGTELGSWDVACHEDGMFIIQPGLYFAGAEKPKTRGVPMGAVFERRQEFEAAWAGWNGKGEIPWVNVPVTTFVSLRLGMARGKPETIGQWLPQNKKVSFDWSTKRRPQTLVRDEFGWRTLPYEDGGITTPYDRAIGGNLLRDLDRLDWQDMPDWAQDLRGWE